MEELLSKWLQVSVTIKKASLNNEKYTYKTKCSYVWLDKQTEETEIVENQKAPLFNYSKEHWVQVDAHIISRFLSHQLIVQVYGMIKSREVKKKVVEDGYTTQSLTDTEGVSKRKMTAQRSMYGGSMMSQSQISPDPKQREELEKLKK